MNNKTVLITGTSSGFGQLSAMKFASEGYNVVATMRSLEKDNILKNYKNIVVTKLDVTKKETIKSAVDEAIEKFGKIDVLVNNAGYGTAGFLEEADDKEIRVQYDTNVIGLINVIQEVLPHMRKEKSGTIINITSIGGSVAVPMFSLYASTKFAVEGLSRSLSYELKEFGIDVKTVAPGGYKTEFGNTMQVVEGNKKDDLDVYRNIYKQHLKQMMETAPKPFKFGDPQEVADEIYRCATKKTKITNFIGKDAKMMILLMKILPECVIRSIIRKPTMPNYNTL